jgi:hypothetical protein
MVAEVVDLSENVLVVIHCMKDIAHIITQKLRLLTVVAVVMEVLVV